MNKESLTSPKTKSILKNIEKWSSSCVMQEVCGFIGEEDGQYTAFLCENKSINPRQHFSIDPLEYLVFLKKYKPVAVFHSHIFGDESASEKDIVMSENSCLPFFIYLLNTNKFNFYVPKKTIADVKTIEEFKKAQ